VTRYGVTETGAEFARGPSLLHASSPRVRANALVGTVSDGPSLPEILRRVADYVPKGAQPGESYRLRPDRWG
jgi:hypothetical protein